ncbi:5-methyltetrahydropteroyltriglutamate--homocysteine S-methyltransferase [Xanthobacter sp. ZOL 2024]
MTTFSQSSIAVATLGTPRIGPRRELKHALESFWAGRTTQAELLATAASLRAANWARQRARGVTIIPSNDFSLYDHVLDTSVMVGAIPQIYGWSGGKVPLPIYFAMARGSIGAQEAACGHAHGASGVPAQEMTKWFDTNYHYMVPEFAPEQRFEVASLKVVDEYREAKALGFDTRPVLLGPVTFLKLGKSKVEGFDPLSLLSNLLPVYTDILRRLAANGAQWVQMDEPALVLDLTDAERAAFRRAYGTFARALPDLKIMLTPYFGALGDNLDTALALPVAGLHLDLCRAPEQLEQVAGRAPLGLVLSLGIIDGRNIWRADLPAQVERLKPVVAKRGTDHVELAPSCSLLHVPIDLEQETDLDPDLTSWLAFSVQKMDELAVLAAALAGRAEEVQPALAASASAAAARRTSPKVHTAAVEARAAAVTPAMGRRAHPFAVRAEVQRRRFALPAFPTTTIGSFPQTAEVRQARAAHAKGALDDEAYAAFLKAETARTIRWQEEIGLDVLVHGEFERNDMVQYFGEQLSGFAFTRHGWVQSYGSRYVRPPILFGDVARPAPMTVAWWRHAQSLTDKPVKGMLTGPVTILNWSFVRDDIPRSAACRQIALAIRDEVHDLERAGAAMIQIDEAALREGLPLRHGEWGAYLDWAVACFRLCASGVADETQIHTHMCYSEFNDIIAAIAAMDADVISIETSRSKMELLDAFKTYKYPNEIGPGVYDIHSPRVPGTEEMAALIGLARQRLDDAQIWINPDCGLKTRKWDEVKPALINMVAAARALRALSA